MGHHGIGALADHLIDNGVTVGKPLTEYLHPVDNYAGLKGKYLVFKADTGEQVSNCFVLRPDKDTAAVEALRAYASVTDNEILTEDIYNWVGKGEAVQECAYWQYIEDDIDEDNNIQAYCSVCGAGDKHATSMIGKVPFCWKCGRKMMPQPPKGE